MEPASHCVADVTYVVFCRLDGGALSQWDAIFRAACQSAPGCCSSPSGAATWRYVVIPLRVKLALAIAERLFHDASGAQLPLRIGIACGKAELIEDLGGPDPSGAVISTAARLANVDDDTHRVAVDETVYWDAVRADNVRYGENHLSKIPQHARVKQTDLVYRWFVPPVPLNVSLDTETAAHVVTYDINGFTSMPKDDQLIVRAKLLPVAERALKPFGGVQGVNKEDSGLWGLTTGDGATMAFRADSGSGDRAWIFSTMLQWHAQRHQITLSLGITTGQVEITDNTCRSGSAVGEAEELTKLAKSGPDRICVSRRFWEESLSEAQRSSWTVRPVQDREDAYYPCRKKGGRDRGSLVDLRGRLGPFGCAASVTLLLLIGIPLITLLFVMTYPPSPPQDVTGTGRGQAGEFTNDIEMRFVRIEPGEFLMGSPVDEIGRQDDETLHRVRLTKSFYIGVTEVSRGQFDKYIRKIGYGTGPDDVRRVEILLDREWALVDGKSWKDPGFVQDEDHPVTAVSWKDATAFCEWLSKEEGRVYRLPTEAEWEYACRAGTTTAYPWGDDPDLGERWANVGDQSAKQVLPADIKPFSWQDGFVYTAPVGRFKPNDWQIRDMVGNVLEWCADYYGPYPDVAEDPKGPDLSDGIDARRVVRGGSWLQGPQDCRSASRNGGPPDSRLSQFGFRCVLERP